MYTYEMSHGPPIHTPPVVAEVILYGGSSQL